LQPNVFPAVLYLAIAIGVMVELNWKLAVLVICFAPVPAIIAAFATPERTRRERALFDQCVRIYSRFNEVLSGILTVRSFSMEDMEKRGFLREVERANQTVIRGVGVDSGFRAATNVVVMIARVAAIGRVFRFPREAPDARLDSQRRGSGAQRLTKAAPMASPVPA